MHHATAVWCVDQGKQQGKGGHQLAILGQVRGKSRMMFIPANLSLKRNPPLVKKLLRFGTESPFLGLCITRWLKLRKALKHSHCGAFCVMVWPLVNVVELAGYVRPHSQVETLQKAIRTSATSNSLTDIALQLAGLHATQHAYADTGHIRLTANDAVNGVTLIAIKPSEIETTAAFLPGLIQSTQQAMQFITVNHQAPLVDGQQISQLLYSGIPDNETPTSWLWCFSSHASLHQQLACLFWILLGQSACLFLGQLASHLG